MKPFIPYSLLAAAALCGVAFGQTATTTPVGYVTIPLQANQFNLVGLTLHNPVVAAGVLDAESATSVTDNEVNFGTSLEAGSTYILELANGTVQEVTSWAGSVLTTPNDITGQVTPGTTTYKLRKAATVADVFGANNSAGLTASADGVLDGVDKVLILNAGGTFDTVFYFNDGAGIQGWFDDSFEDASNKAIVYPDAFFVQKAGTASSLVVSGEVKTVPTGGALMAGWNYVGGLAPVGLTVGTTGLESFFAPSADGTIDSADLLLLQNPDGTYKTTFYFNDGAGTVGWFDDAFESVSSDALGTAVLIFSRSGPKAFTVSVPASYSTL
jgi:hypothetical protein